MKRSDKFEITSGIFFGLAAAIFILLAFSFSARAGFALIGAFCFVCSAGAQKCADKYKDREALAERRGEA